jgi:Predicted transcriptional regulators
MTIANSFSHLHFPCACVSNVEENNTDPWAAIAKNGLLAGRTKEEIINLVAESPKTISQLAKALELSAPSVFKHVSELLESDLIRDSAESEKAHPKERYYEPNFPVVSADECGEVVDLCNDVSNEIASLFEECMPRFEEAFSHSSLAKQGWSLQDVSQCLYAHIQRRARQTLEDRGAILAAQPHANGAVWSFWAERPSGDEACT